MARLIGRVTHISPFPEIDLPTCGRDAAWPKREGFFGASLMQLFERRLLARAENSNHTVSAVCRTVQHGMKCGRYVPEGA